MGSKIVCWWSGGITSAVSCKIAIDLFGVKNCDVIFIDTKNEDPDTYRFKDDCEIWYGCKINSISAIGPGKKYESIEDVWFDYGYLNVAHGAICSSELKRQVRLDYQKRNDYLHQVFGFDFSKRESNRCLNIKRNYPSSKPIFPLWMYGYSKNDCARILNENGIEVPQSYKNGFDNNNCIMTGCVQGGVGYWQKYKRVYPERFEKMAEREHILSGMQGKPITICKDQSKEAKDVGLVNVFLKHNPKYPKHKDISMIKGVEPMGLPECNGFCGTQFKMFE